MSSSDQSSTGKKENDKTRETCRRGPEDGYPFIVDEVFVSSHQCFNRLALMITYRNSAVQSHFLSQSP